MTDDPIPGIDELFPELSPSERAEAEEDLRRYVALMLLVFERLEGHERAHIDEVR